MQVRLRVDGRSLAHLLAVAAASVASLAGCSAPPSGTGGAGGGGAGPGVESVCSDWASRVCALVARCDSILLASFRGDEPGCELGLAQECETELRAPGAPGHDAATAVACFGAQTFDACEDLSNPPFPPGCPSGTLPTGSTCFSHIQCAGRGCAGSPTTCGTCIDVPEVGAACRSNGDCPLLGGCIGGACVAPGRIGDACLPGTCAFGLRCDAGSCAPALGLGEPCLPGDCSRASGLACDAMTATCQPVQIVDEGGSCGNVAELPANVCRYPDVCLVPGLLDPNTLEGTCRPGGRIGDPCPNTICRDGALCQNGVCVAADGITCGALPP